MSFASLMPCNFPQLHRKAAQPIPAAAPGCDTFQGIRRSQEIINQLVSFGGAYKPAPFVWKHDDVRSIPFHASKHVTGEFADVKKIWRRISKIGNIIPSIGKNRRLNAVR